jgi:signal transduction histidine kinase
MDDRELERIGRTDDELRADCLRLIAHDINNPLTAIRILAEMLRDEVGSTEMRQDMVDILEAADLASALMDGMSGMVRLEQQDEEYSWFSIDLVELVRGAVDRPALRRHLKLELPRELQMSGDRGALGRALTDVFVNARRLSEGQIVVSLREDGAWAELRVFHPGPGIPPAARDRLFEMFGTVALRQSRIPVSAVGLVYAKAVVDNHGGTMRFQDRPAGFPGADPGVDLVIRLSR